MLRSLLFTVILMTSQLGFAKKSHDLCSTALFHIASCLALQSDFNDEINLKQVYSGDSDCIQGVKFYGGILPDDRTGLFSVYQVKFESTEDPLQRTSEVIGPNMATVDYCGGKIEMLVANEEKSHHIVFSVTENNYHGDPKPEIAIEF